jgi:hypothetical protein
MDMAADGSGMQPPAAAVPATPATADTNTPAGGSNLASGDSVDAWTTGSSTTRLAATASRGGGGKRFVDKCSWVLALGGVFGAMVVLMGVAYVFRRRCSSRALCPKETSRPQTTARTDAKTLELLFASPQRDAVEPVDDGADGTVVGMGTDGGSTSGKLSSLSSSGQHVGKLSSPVSRMAKVHPVMPEVWI